MVLVTWVFKVIYSSRKSGFRYSRELSKKPNYQSIFVQKVYYKIYKPFQVLSQFTPEIPGQATLADLFDFPKDVYPVGRLDNDSEGLLLLTNDKNVNAKLLNPKWQHSRTYWVQVDGAPKAADLDPIREGMTIRVRKKEIHTLPAKAFLLENAPELPERVPPIRVRKNIPTTWLSLTLQEGKNRQVRRMTAGIGFPTLRLVRYAIEGISIAGMQSGSVESIDKALFYRLLKLDRM